MALDSTAVHPFPTANRANAILLALVVGPLAFAYTRDWGSFVIWTLVALLFSWTIVIPFVIWFVTIFTISQKVDRFNERSQRQYLVEEAILQRAK